MSAEAGPPGDRFQPGDVIHAVDSVSVASLSELRRAAKDMKAGDAVVVQIERDGLFHYVAFELWEPGTDGFLLHITKGKHERHAIHVTR
jgi:S1-C subfamily serine protease